MRAPFWIVLAIAGNIFAEHTYCLGPENFAGNAPVHPKGCNGQWRTTFAGFYWNAHQEGIEFALKNGNAVPVINPFLSEIQEVNHVSDGRYLTPHSKWQFGFKLALGYDLPCDGWDFEATWTEYQMRSKKTLETEAPYDSLIPLFSAFSPAQGVPLYARQIQALWKIELDLLDFDFGREYWTSKRLNLRPHLGLRLVRIAQNFDLTHKGGSWSPRMNPNQEAFNNLVKLDNIFKGIGLRSGLDTRWHFECGFGLYSNFAASIVFGPFKVEEREKNRFSASPYTVDEILSTNERFRASRAILDYALGIQWSRKFCDCAYEVTTQFGWEGHLFFNQNQFWRVNRYASVQENAPNPTGQNVYTQSRGSLDMQGWTLSFRFEF